MNALPPQLNTTTPLQYLKGVGPKLSEVFAKKGISTVGDLIHWHPRIYRDQRVIHDFSKLKPHAYITLYGYVAHKKVFSIAGGRKQIYEMVIKSPAGYLSCKYFRLPYRGYFDSLEIDQKVKVTGQVSYYRNQPELTHPDIHPFSGEEDDQQDMLIPVYTEIEKISQHKIRKMIATAFEALIKNEDFLHSDPLPDWLKKEYQLKDKIPALREIHQPCPEEAELYLRFRASSQKRLIFDDFFFLQLYMGMKKAGLQKKTAPSIKIHRSNWKAPEMKVASTLSPEIDRAHGTAPVVKMSDKGENPPDLQSTFSDKVRKSLSFSLTQAQERVLREIEQDMQKSHPMHRLIQGDVGCGKTIVALLATCPVMENGFQCAIMAPTEILAEQHYQNALSLLKPLHISVSLLTGKTRARVKREISEKLLSGYTSLCVGTHALIQESVQFKKPGLVIVDEQHRFGVHQRALLKSKGVGTHFLVMTATPIPRSLAMTLYGDLNVSVIDEMPQGRKPVITKRVWPARKEKMWDFVEKQIQQGRQAYVVYPLVEESEHIDLKNAVQEYEKLKKRFPDLKIGLLHGRLSPVEKQEVMSFFAKGEIQILVSTTVIEVGVDVANASVMIVEHADRFGLSQLHQLRGRVGRGGYESYCLLALSQGFSEEAKARLSIMEKTSDGFKIAEVDLEIRGPGEFLGTKQSGLPEFKMANLIRDGQILETAKSAVLKVLAKDPLLKESQHQGLKQEVSALSHRLLPG